MEKKYHLRTVGTGSAALSVVSAVNTDLHTLPWVPRKRTYPDISSVSMPDNTGPSGRLAVAFKIMKDF